MVIVFKQDLNPAWKFWIGILYVNGYRFKNNNDSLHAVNKKLIIRVKLKAYFEHFCRKKKIFHEKFVLC